MVYLYVTGVDADIQFYMMFHWILKIMGGVLDEDLELADELRKHHVEMRIPGFEASFHSTFRFYSPAVENRENYIGDVEVHTDPQSPPALVVKRDL